MAGIGPGPFCGMLLADRGADVVRVDRPGGGGIQLVAWGDYLLDRGKRSIAVDLTKPVCAETRRAYAGSTPKSSSPTG